ncbi:MAG: transcription antitermination factor NusB [Candidatus Zixiibacteriota bacterium]
MTRRRQGRELVLGCLYAHFATGQEPTAVFDGQAGRVTYDKKTLTYARKIFSQALADSERIDRAIRDAAAHWDFGRIGSIEKNILRAAIAELWFCPETPARVIIDEAVDLAKQYAGAEAGSFVNGVLDRVYKLTEQAGEQPPSTQTGHS